MVDIHTIFRKYIMTDNIIILKKHQSYRNSIYRGIFEITPREHEELGEQFRFRFVNTIFHYIYFVYKILIHD